MPYRAPLTVLALAVLSCCGADSAQDPLPACLRALIAECPHEPACTFESPDSARKNICYASGTRVTETALQTCAVSGGPREARHLNEARKPDGSLCYTIESSCVCGHACETGTTRWSDGAGRTVMTVGSVDGYDSYTCKGEEPVRCDNFECEFDFTPRGCKQGACSIEE